jgi:hypothetical protein
VWAGLLAVRAAWLGDDAAAYWRECARRWRELGDQQRAAQAERYAGDAAAAHAPRPAGPSRARLHPPVGAHPRPPRSSIAWLVRLAMRDRESLVALAAFRLNDAALRVAAWLRLGPYLTVAASVVAVAGASALILYDHRGHLVWAGVVLVVGWFFEILDGQVAPGAKDGPRAVYFEQVVDRFVEAALLGAIAWHFRGPGNGGVTVLSLATLVLALITSFERAESEALGFAHGNATFGRILRLLLLVPALLFPLMRQLMVVITAVTALSLVRRFLGVWRERVDARAARGFDPAALTAPRYLQLQLPLPPGRAHDHSERRRREWTRRLARSWGRAGDGADQRG